MEKQEKKYINMVIFFSLVFFLGYSSLIWIYIMGVLIFLAPFIFKRVTKKIAFYNTLSLIAFISFVYITNSWFT
ncbi:hypothetical protein CN980_31970 [Bacillus cereus]|uniref:Uncharacterized protein n=1 Tax=Bacillus cereus TaxID=1396 RepID=A0A9X7C4X7_BACCE|nr:hypothetical protein ACS75_20725 [Bacillus thuringiensis]PEK54481.1 hypothetical protein CN592_04540 [Bacillus toyonensis]PGO56281.1 hypothetical protein CN980_31970 [Bacillus cereus]QEQ20296.1 hypothetical protein F0362_27230 [Bacillus sp. BS98]